MIMDYLSEEGLSTYDAQIKGYVNAQMAQRSEIPASQMAVINDIDTNVDTILENYVTKTDLQSALANIGGSEAVTIYINNASGNAHVDVVSGDTVIKANVSNGETVNIPFGTEYSVVSYDENGAYIEKQTAVAAKTSSSYHIMIKNGFSVDLGLPSGKIWATRNVGANTPLEYGLFFSWGNLEGFYNTTSSYNFSEYNYGLSPGYSLTSSFTSGDPAYDAARANMGGTWRVPTKDEWQELVSNCSWAWKDTNREYHYVGTKNNKSIVLYYTPVLQNKTALGGYAKYWSSDYRDSTLAYIAGFNSNTTPTANNIYESRQYGLPIRAIMDAPSQS